MHTTAPSGSLQWANVSASLGTIFCVGFIVCGQLARSCARMEVGSRVATDQQARRGGVGAMGEGMGATVRAGCWGGRSVGWPSGLVGWLVRVGWFGRCVRV